ncbi:MAG: hypothetical protein HQM11_01980 [SAR324 cluster bacterium]|nr:hypothetical protein [SAR324 cluster bacterium]
MQYIIPILVFVAIVSSLLILFGVGIGYLLYALIPGMEIGTGIVAGAIFAVGLPLLLFTSGMATEHSPSSKYVIREEEEDEDEDDDEEDTIIHHVPPRNISASRKRRRRPPRNRNF